MKKYILVIMLSIVSLVSFNITQAQTATNEWDACKGDNVRNGDKCSYSKVVSTGSNEPTTQTLNGFCDRAGGLSGGTFYCGTGKNLNGWKDCFLLGDACSQDGKVGVCSGTTNGSKGTCDTTKTPPGNPGGSTPATCGGKTCDSNTEVCAILGGSPTCTKNASTPGTTASDGTTPDATAPQTVGFINPIRFNSLTELIAGIINALLGILGAITVAVLVMSGFKYMISSNPGEVGQALEGIRNAIIGLMIIMGAFLITQYVISALAG